MSPREEGKVIRPSAIPARVITPPPTPIWTPPTSPREAPRGHQPVPEDSYYEEIQAPVVPAPVHPTREQAPEPQQEEISETIDLMPQILGRFKIWMCFCNLKTIL